MKNILFITWDSDKTNYLENLFFPIFSGLQKRGVAKVTVFQFSWAKPEEVARISELANKENIGYVRLPISTTLPSSIASLQAILANRRRVLNVIKSQQIDTIIPRSTMPAFLILTVYKQIRFLGCQLIFDADGLPIQERLDQGALKKNSMLHRILSGVEVKILHKSDRVITRTQRTVDWHRLNSPNLSPTKFFLVGNGRDSLTFYFDKVARSEIRRKLIIAEEELLIVHSGSLGPAYSIDLLFEILYGMKKAGITFRMSFLTRDSAYLERLIPDGLKKDVQLLQIPFKEIPAYLSAADLGISLRTPSPSVRGILPIKVGEYLMCGLPILISSGIGDLDDVLSENSACYFMNHKDFSLAKIASWVQSVKGMNRTAIQQRGKEIFALEKTLDSYYAALK